MLSHIWASHSCFPALSVLLGGGLHVVEWARWPRTATDCWSCIKKTLAVFRQIFMQGDRLVAIWLMLVPYNHLQGLIRLSCKIVSRHSCVVPHSSLVISHYFSLGGLRHASHSTSSSYTLLPKFSNNLLSFLLIYFLWYTILLYAFFSLEMQYDACEMEAGEKTQRKWDTGGV